MYINNIWLVYYLIIGLVGLMIGKIAAWSNTVYVEEGTLTFRDFWKNRKQVFKMQYILMFIIAFLYILLLYFTGLPNNLVKALNLVKFMLLIPMLVSSFLIDFKHRIIPNRLNMTMFEIGLIFTFIYGTFNISIARDMLLGCLIGGGIFLAITLIGGLIAGKEAMGLGDVKFMGAIGLYFGAIPIGEVSLLGFFVAAIFGIIILIYRKIRKNDDEYIPFGPFLVISAIVVMFAEKGFVIRTFYSFCKMLSSLLIGGI